MRLFITMLITVISFTGSFAEEATINIDRAALITAGNNESDFYRPRIAIHFSLPDELEDADIIHAEIELPFNFNDMEYGGNGLVEIQAYDISSSWSEESPVRYDNINTSNFYTYTIDLADQYPMHMDITTYIQSAADGQLNYGLMLIPIKLDQEDFNLPVGVARQLKRLASVKVLYE